MDNKEFLDRETHEEQPVAVKVKRKVPTMYALRKVLKPYHPCKSGLQLSKQFKTIKAWLRDVNGLGTFSDQGWVAYKLDLHGPIGAGQCSCTTCTFHRLSVKVRAELVYKAVRRELKKMKGRANDREK